MNLNRFLLKFKYVGVIIALGYIKQTPIYCLCKRVYYLLYYNLHANIYPGLENTSI